MSSSSTRTLSSQESERIARILAVDIVSWQWNWRGRLTHLVEGRWSKLGHIEERGVISQQIKEVLGPFIPDITVMRRGALRVDYGKLAEEAYEVALLLDREYRRTTTKQNRALTLNSLVTAHVPPEPQAGAVGLLAITKLYADEMKPTNSYLASKKSRSTMKN